MPAPRARLLRVLGLSSLRTRVSRPVQALVVVLSAAVPPCELRGGWRGGERRVLVDERWLFERFGWTQPCPPEHGARLELAGLPSACPRGHGCPLCRMSWSEGAFTQCAECQRAHEACWDREEELRGLVVDPYCFVHGVPTPATWRSCELCSLQRRLARSRGWKGQATGHRAYGECVHCDVCGACQGSGRVCGDCYRCLDHTAAAGTLNTSCERVHWNRLLRVEQTYYDHRVYDAATGRWSS